MSIGHDTLDDDDNGTSGVITPRKPLGRQAIERNAEIRARNEDERPRYSKDSLAELKNSTPSTPKDVSQHVSSAEEESVLDGGARKTLDLASKFGTSASSAKTKTNAIPTAAEIREKKERRARLAKEKDDDFISLNPSDSDEEARSRELLIRPKEKYAETRLVREDEDLAEGFEDFVDDGGVALGRKAEREERARKRREMEEAINEAENMDVEGEDDSEAERNEAYEAAQTRKGTYGSSQQRDAQSREERERPRTPPKITAVPDLNSVLSRMRDGLQEMRDVKANKEQRLKELQAEKKEIGEREVWIQKQLKEVGERYEKLRVEAGMTGEPGANGVVAERGLESFGNTPKALTPRALTPMIADVEEG